MIFLRRSVEQCFFLHIFVNYLHFAVRRPYSYLVFYIFARHKCSMCNVFAKRATGANKMALFVVLVRPTVGHAVCKSHHQGLTIEFDNKVL